MGLLNTTGFVLGTTRSSHFFWLRDEDLVKTSIGSVATRYQVGAEKREGLSALGNRPAKFRQRNPVFEILAALVAPPRAIAPDNEARATGAEKNISKKEERRPPSE
jgi:hypothetical protein